MIRRRDGRMASRRLLGVSRGLGIHMHVKVLHHLPAMARERRRAAESFISDIEAGCAAGNKGDAHHEPTDLSGDCQAVWSERGDAAVCPVPAMEREKKIGMNS